MKVNGRIMRSPVPVPLFHLVNSTAFVIPFILTFFKYLGQLTLKTECGSMLDFEYILGRCVYELFPKVTF